MVNSLKMRYTRENIFLKKCLIREINYIPNVKTLNTSMCYLINKSTEILNLRGRCTSIYISQQISNI